MAAVVQGYIQGGRTYISKDGGATWTTGSSWSREFWLAVAMSWNGRTIAAVSGNIDMSWDSGVTFRGYAPLPPNNFGRNTYAYTVAMSADGTKLLVSDGNGSEPRFLYTAQGPVP